MTIKLEPGWVDQIAKQIMAERYEMPPPPARKTMRQSKAHDIQCALNGSRKGGANTVRKLDRLLGKADE